MNVSEMGPEPGRSPSSSGPSLYQRALAIWPRLDTRALRRCRHDPRRVARLVSRRTSLPIETILAMLTMPRVSDEERATWFG
jgi:hypothetical protein